MTPLSRNWAIVCWSALVDCGCFAGTEVVFVPKDKWPQIRREYIRDHGLDKRQPANEAPAPTPASQQDSAEAASADQQSPATGDSAGPADPVSKAEELFGSEIVKVEDN